MFHTFDNVKVAAMPVIVLTFHSKYVFYQVELLSVIQCFSSS